jgi:hypothetical protein
VQAALLRWTEPTTASLFSNANASAKTRCENTFCPRLADENDDFLKTGSEQT